MLKYCRYLACPNDGSAIGDWWRYFRCDTVLLLEIREYMLNVILEQAVGLVEVIVDIVLSLRTLVLFDLSNQVFGDITDILPVDMTVVQLEISWDILNVILEQIVGVVKMIIEIVLSLRRLVLLELSNGVFRDTTDVLHFDKTVVLLEIYGVDDFVEIAPLFSTL